MFLMTGKIVNEERLFHGVDCHGEEHEGNLRLLHFVQFADYLGEDPGPIDTKCDRLMNMKRALKTESLL